MEGGAHPSSFAALFFPDAKKVPIYWMRIFTERNVTNSKKFVSEILTENTPVCDMVIKCYSINWISV